MYIWASYLEGSVGDNGEWLVDRQLRYLEDVYTPPVHLGQRLQQIKRIRKCEHEITKDKSINTQTFLLHDPTSPRPTNTVGRTRLE